MIKKQQNKKIFSLENCLGNFALKWKFACKTL